MLGALVKKIQDARATDSSDIKKGLISDNSESKQDVLMIVFNHVQIELMRRSIQKICKHIIPAGECMDYVQEDIDSMNSEMEYWRNQRIQIQDLIQDESKYVF